VSFVPLVRAFLSVLFRENRQRHLAMLWLVCRSPLAAAMLRDRLFGCCPRTAFDKLVLLSAASVVVGVLDLASLAVGRDGSHGWVVFRHCSGSETSVGATKRAACCGFWRTAALPTSVGRSSTTHERWRGGAAFGCGLFRVGERDLLRFRVPRALELRRCDWCG
jgi:hypothetical protein